MVDEALQESEKVLPTPSPMSATSRETDLINPMVTRSFLADLFEDLPSPYTTEQKLDQILENQKALFSLMSKLLGQTQQFQQGRDQNLDRGRDQNLAQGRVHILDQERVYNLDWRRDQNLVLSQSGESETFTSLWEENSL